MNKSIFFLITELLIFFYIKSLFFKISTWIFLGVTPFQNVSTLKLWMKVTFILLSSSLFFLMSVGKWKKRLLYLFIYQHLPTERNPDHTARISEVEISKGRVPTETIPPFLLALLQTNVQSHPGPASTGTYAWFQKGWRSCVLKEVTLRHKIKHIQKSEQDQNLKPLYRGIP